MTHKMVLQVVLLSSWLLAGSGLGLAAQSSAPKLRPVGRLDGFATSGYHWRGIHRSSGPLFQLDGAGGLAFRSFAATGGIWANLDPRRSSARHYSDLPIGMKGFSEYDAWGQLSYQNQTWTVAGGSLWSWYRRPGPDPRVTELFGLLRLQTGRWSYAVQGWHAIDGVKGTYLEPCLSYDHLVWPFAGPAITWVSTLSAGIQAGRRLESDSVPGAVGTGLTHVSLSNGVRMSKKVIEFIAITATTALEVEYRRDPATRLLRDGSLGHRLKLWLPLQVGITLPWRRPGE